MNEIRWNLVGGPSGGLMNYLLKNYPTGGFSMTVVVDNGRDQFFPATLLVAKVERGPEGVKELSGSVQDTSVKFKAIWWPILDKGELYPTIE